MTIQVVDNKKLDMTNDEFSLYQRIVQSYTGMGTRGEDMFVDLFESNEDGVITFLKPPSKRHTSLEVFLFLMALMQHQHLRIMRQEVSDIIGELKKKTTIQ
jgi:hypothetical protein